MNGPFGGQIALLPSKVKSALCWLGLALLVAACSTGPELTTLPPVTETATGTPTPTFTATWTPSPTPTFTPTPTSTPTPALAGTPYTGGLEGMVEINLPHLVELARWGRGISRDLAWSPDGRELAVASSLGVFLFEAPEMTERGWLPADDARRVAYAQHGKKLITAGSGLQIWNTETLEREQSLSSEAAPSVLGMRLSPDGSQLGILGWALDGQKLRLEVWNLETGALVREADWLRTGARTRVAALSPDFSLVAAHGGGLVELIRATDGARLTTLTLEDTPPGGMAFSPDGTTLAVAYPDARRDFQNTNRVEVYRVPDGDKAFTLWGGGGVEGSAEGLISLAFSPDGRWIAAGFANRVVRVWANQAGAVRFTLNGSALPLQLAFSPDGELVASSALDVWAVGRGEQVAASPTHFETIQEMALSPDGQTLALAGFDTIELRSMADGQLIRQITDLPGPVRGISFYPGAQTLAAAAGDGLVRLYRVRDGRFLSMLGEAGPPLWAVVFSPDSRWLAWGGEGQTVFLYDLVKDQLALKIKEPYLPARLVFSPISNTLAVLTSSGVNLRTIDGTLIRSVGGAGIEDAAFWLDGSQLAVAGNQVCRVIDLETGADVVALDYREGDSPSAVAYSGDGAFLAVGWRSGMIELYWAGTKEMLRRLEGHHGAVRRILFTPDGRLMLSLAEDGTIRVWGITP
jgi:WD40 repeat protein